MTSDHPRPLGASPWIARFCASVPAGARVLDFAAGSGRHAELLVGRAVRYLAVDVDARSLAELDRRLGADFRRAGGALEVLAVDLETGPWPLARGSFDLVMVSNFLHRSRLPLLADLLAPGGMLLYETFAEGQALFGRPRRPDFLLQPGELLRLCAQAGLHVLAYEDGVVGPAAPAPESDDGDRIGPDARALDAQVAIAAAARRQRLCALRPPIDWQASLGSMPRLG